MENKNDEDSATPCNEGSRGNEGYGEACTLDGSIDRLGRPARRDKTGRWPSGLVLLVNQGLLSIAFVGVEVNLVLFSTRVLKQSNAEAANNFSRWMGTTNLFSLLGAFLSDAYLGRYLTCVIFQVFSIIGLVMLWLTTTFMLLKPHGCGKIGFSCDPHSPLEMAMFYISIYMVALGYGASEPSSATFGSSQFDEEDPGEKTAKNSFYSYFYVATNIGSLFAETVLAYIQNLGQWTSAFMVATSCSAVAYVMLLSGSVRYRHFKTGGNPLARFCQVLVAAWKKSKVEIPLEDDKLFEVNERNGSGQGGRRILHTKGFRFFDHAAIIANKDQIMGSNRNNEHNPWNLCTVTQVEEVKCIMRLLPIWLCTIFFSVIIVQMASLFVEQGAAMKTTINNFHIPPASMTVFDIISVSFFIIFFNKLIAPVYRKITKMTPEGPSEITKMGIGLVIAFIGMITAGLVEQKRLKHAQKGGPELSSLSILWQVPQYVLIGVSEALVYVGQLDFFGSQTPDGMKSIGIGLCMFSNFLGSYLCSFIVSIVMEVTTKGGRPGWIPANLNDGHLDRFFFLMAGMTIFEFIGFFWCARHFKFISLESKSVAEQGA
ncbi:Proton-dependent oligopeptide transporter family protein [Dioscorea alata]|uniref:Proton-dependent oligopeptide transporter family protein n=1 Tax=Dioscorea alata TaxID=55571 RepID=A0ACB7WGE8_DIOAL|nr:Proton-dependent oligopeptide transporter family protein [Dioscorea alata]